MFSARIQSEAGRIFLSPPDAIGDFLWINIGGYVIGQQSYASYDSALLGSIMREDEYNQLITRMKDVFNRYGSSRSFVIFVYFTRIVIAISFIIFPYALVLLPTASSDNFYDDDIRKSYDFYRNLFQAFLVIGIVSFVFNVALYLFYVQRFLVAKLGEAAAPHTACFVPFPKRVVLSGIDQFGAPHQSLVGGGKYQPSYFAPTWPPQNFNLLVDCRGTGIRGRWPVAAGSQQGFLPTTVAFVGGGNQTIGGINYASGGTLMYDPAQVLPFGPPDIAATTIGHDHDHECCSCTT
jgi:hypothetical protein